MPAGISETRENMSIESGVRSPRPSDLKKEISGLAPPMV
jgi:hypothetical protein